MNMNENFPTIAAAALEYAARGWHVFPARIKDGSKRSYVAGKQNGGARWGATTDPDTIRDYWQQFPEALLGITTGTDSGFFVIDADTPEGHDKDGVGTLRGWIEQHGPLPHTIEATTPSGGWHLYFRWPDDLEIRNSESKLASGIDVRGEGGMVLCPPTIKPGGSTAYSWNNPPGFFDLADCPEWLLDKIREAQAPKLSERAKHRGVQIDTGGATAWADKALQGELATLLAAPEGKRNGALNSAAFSLGQIVAGGSLDETTVKTRLTAAAEGIGLEPGETTATINSGFQAGIQTPREPRERTTGAVAHAEPTKASESPKATTMFQFIRVADLKYRAPEFVIGELIETDTLGLMFGDPGCGKSFLAVDIALSVASGTPFHGRNVKQGAVFFIAGEGHNGLARRFAAWSNARGFSLSGVPLFKSERAAQFLDGASATAVADAVAGLASEHGSPALIIIDTLARNFGAGDENNTKDMSEFVVAIDDLKARFPGCSVLIVHHSGHAEKQRARGAMALKGALDAEYRVEKTGNLMQLVKTKMKDAEPPQDLFFSFKQVDLDGIAKSAVLEATEAPEKQHKLTAAQRLAQQTYITAAAQSGIWEDGTFSGVHVDDWRDAFYSKSTGDTADAKKKAFQRVRRELVDSDRMTVTDDVYLVRDAALQMTIMMQRDKRDIPGQNEKCPGAEAGNAGTNGTNA